MAFADEQTGFRESVRKVDRGFISSPDQGSISQGPNRASKWQRKYVAWVLIGDIVVTLLVTFAAQTTWLRWTANVELAPLKRSENLPYVLITLIIVSVWIASLYFSRTYDPRILAVGDQEYAGIVRGSLVALAVISASSYWLKAEVARGYLLIAFPVGAMLLVFTRWVWRQVLAHQRRNGNMKTPVLVIGRGQAFDAILKTFIRGSRSPYQVVAVSSTLDKGLPVHSEEAWGHKYLSLPFAEDVSRQMREVGAEAVVIVSGEMSTAARIREIGWTLDQQSQQMLLAPALTDVAGPRISLHPIAGLALMRVDPAGPTKLGRAIKRMFDFFVSLLLLAVLSVPMLVVAAFIKLSDGGPVFFYQERVGFLGGTFRMVKFRSMKVGAEAEAAALHDGANADAGNEVLFKMKDDPRITRVGRFIRRYSIDELPQLFNVLSGSMSLVGPRPPLPSEVNRYEDRVYMKFLVKPGITGLWQVSGRSNLSWEESVRMDLYYVENWSFIGDIRILWQTIKAVVQGDGAY